MFAASSTAFVAQAPLWLFAAAGVMRCNPLAGAVASYEPRWIVWGVTELALYSLSRSRNGDRTRLAAKLLVFGAGADATWGSTVPLPHWTPTIFTRCNVGPPWYVTCASGVAAPARELPASTNIPQQTATTAP